MPGKAAFEVGLVLGELWEAAALPTQPWGHLLPTAEPGRESIAQRLPLGVVGVISPWNFPQILSVRAVAPALALGNAVILKPDVHTAVSGGVLVAAAVRGGRAARRACCTYCPARPRPARR